MHFNNLFVATIVIGALASVYSVAEAKNNNMSDECRTVENNGGWYSLERQCRGNSRSRSRHMEKRIDTILAEAKDAIAPINAGMVLADSTETMVTKNATIK
ncbi:hypothetical protein BDF19DRAFT_411250 [Syncephalis fuscata]|nr:hypothetical protein BDF19DRAFT_411250 [Syncephalis fuscata]